MGAIVWRVVKIQLGLNADVHTFVLALALDGTESRAFLNHFLLEDGFFGEGKAGLRIVEIGPAAADAVIVQAARYFAAPVGFAAFRAVDWCGIAVSRSAGRSGCDDTYGYRCGRFGLIDERSVTERTILGILEQEGAAMRTNMNHQSVLRCGRSR
jgi:hypothetical protein